MSHVMRNSRHFNYSQYLNVHKYLRTSADDTSREREDTVNIMILYRCTYMVHTIDTFQQYSQFTYTLNFN